MATATCPTPSMPESFEFLESGAHQGGSDPSRPGPPKQGQRQHQQGMSTFPFPSPCIPGQAGTPARGQDRRGVRPWLAGLESPLLNSAFRNQEGRFSRAGRVERLSFLCVPRQGSACPPTWVQEMLPAGHSFRGTARHPERWDVLSERLRTPNGGRWGRSRGGRGQ